MNFILEKLLKKAAKNSEKLTAKRPDEDFIPYVCHYDQNTILTKNGELLQIIRISGLSKNSAISELSSLREEVREAVLDNVKENKYALWFNTIRRRKNISPKGEFGDVFSKKLNEHWVKQNKWDNQFINELYITVITEGLDTSITNLNQFVRSLSYNSTKSLHRNHLAAAHQKLSKIVEGILKGTSDYGSKLLGFSEWEGILYSEPIRFFGKIVNLYEERYPVAASDISSDLTSHKVAFGDRELEVVGYENKNFAAMFSLKEYFEVSTEMLDHVLQLPFEFIITQSFDFTFDKKNLEQREYQDYILRVSGDEDFRELSGVSSFVKENKGQPTDYGKQQITLMTISKNKDDLETEIKKLFEQFSALGFVLVREDIFLEHCFWSQLPANFRFLRRQKIINTSKIGGFAALHNFPSGSISGNKWGPAIATFKTVLNTPYFFNFHDIKSNNSIFIGDNKSGKTTLINFLIAQSRRCNPKIFYLDSNKSSKTLIKAMGGKYFSFESENNEEFLAMNPMKFVNNNSKNFLNIFFKSLIGTDYQINQQEEEIFQQVIDRIVGAKPESLSSAIETFGSLEDLRFYEGLKKWAVGGKFEKIFNSENQSTWSQNINGFDLSFARDNHELLAPVTFYLLEKIESALDGSPTLIVVDDGLLSISGQEENAEFVNFLDRASQKNCAVIISTSNFENISKELLEKISIRVFLSNSNPHKNYKDLLMLSDEEISIIKMINSSDPHFFIKNSENSIIAEFNLSKNVPLLKILSADEITSAATEKTIKTVSENPDQWVPKLIDVLKIIEEERKIAEKHRLREEALAKRKALLA